jgi:Protein of unknown function (DUF1549)/Protein of unknown function (DUF1553)
MPRTSLVATVRLSQWPTKGWTPLVPSRRFRIIPRLDFARRGFVRRLVTVSMWAGVVAGWGWVTVASAAEPAAIVVPPTADSSEPAAAVANAPAATAAPALPAPVKLDHLSVEPASVSLGTAEERVQLVVTAFGTDGSMMDMTHKVEYCPADAKVARVDDGIVIPAGDGGADIEVRMTDPADGHQLSVRVPVTVQGYGVVRGVDFANDVEPILSKFACNSGGCHGKASGQNGFKLSLLGVDTALDYDALVKQGHGRRVFPAAPDRSLLLTKPTGQCAHGGGKRFEVDSAAYRLLRRWVEQGMPMGKPDSPSVARIDAVPAERIMQRSSSQQLRVVATLSDGTTKDVTAEAEYRSQQPDLVTVDTDGQASTQDAVGEGTVMVRYRGMVEIARLTVPFGREVPSDAYARFQPRNFVDNLVLTKWQKLGIAPSDRASDSEYLRRAYLDVIGTLPTSGEALSFLNDQDPDKRAHLIDRLLARNEYASFWAGKWGDVLRNKRRGDEAKRGTYAFAAWIRDAFQQNMPYDEFARAILTAQGNVSDTPPVNWYREARNITHQVNDTAQLFLGTRIQCANCHHHPYERWSEDDYWGFAAFFGRLGRKAGDVGTDQAIFVRKDGGVNQPRTHKAMLPTGLGGKPVPYVRGEDPRQYLVDWMVQPDNPFFSRAIANRIWSHFLGVGLVEAVDDLRVTNPPSNPELLDALAKDLVDHKFDLKHLIRTITTSEVYALSSLPTQYNAKDRRNFARFFPKRMPAEVLSDAVDAVCGSTEKFSGFPLGTRAIDLPDEGVNSYFLDVFGRSQRESPCECERSYAPNLAQVLHLINSPELQRKLTDGQGRAAKLIAEKKSPEDMVTDLYLTGFGRVPQPEEMTEATAVLRETKDQKGALTDLMWVMLNSKEFLFNH